MYLVSVPFKKITKGRLNECHTELWIVMIRLINSSQ